MTQEDQLYLHHIHDELIFLEKIKTTTTYHDLLADEIKQRAVIRSLEIIGEAANNISPQYRTQNPQIPWRKLTDTRNRLIHGYFSVSMLIVYEIISKEAEPLLKQITTLIEQQK